MLLEHTSELGINKVPQPIESKSGTGTSMEAVETSLEIFKPMVLNLPDLSKIMCLMPPSSWGGQRIQIYYMFSYLV